MSRKADKDREDIEVEITHKHVPRELEDFQVQRRQRYEHSYDMTMDMPTIPGPIEERMRSTLETYFKDERYDPEKMKQLASDAADEIKQDAIKMVSPRVRIVCQVLVGQKSGQAARAISRCLWDPEKDRFMRAFLENQELFVSATVFALYFE